VSADFKNRLSEAICHAVDLDNDLQVKWTLPKREGQGDLSTNIAMILANQRKTQPRQLADEILKKVVWPQNEIEHAEVAGPGFINIWISNDHYRKIVNDIITSGRNYGASDIGAGHKVIVEFVSANPTGPLNIVSARAAAIGDSLVRVLNKTGFDVSAEFYVNDSGKQIRKLGESVIAISRNDAVPEDGYHGDDIISIAKELSSEGVLSIESDPENIGKAAAKKNVVVQKDALESYGVNFDRWFLESELHQQGGPETALEKLKAVGAVKEEDGATWFSGSKFGDEDRVIITSEGRPTYLLPDISYHLNKAERGFDTAIDLLGPDHHDYAGRMRAAMKALGHDSFLEVLIVQQVHFVSGGEKVKMSKRAGKIVTLQQLIEEVGEGDLVRGRDIARYFFMQRRTSTPLEFDLDLAKEQSERNPVFYVQYAHTRICGILRQDGCPDPLDADLSYLDKGEEINLIKHLEQFGEIIQRAAESREPQKLVSYLHDLATTFHKFYTACRVVGVEKNISAARAALSNATRIVLAEGLNLLGVSAPERM